MKVCGRTQEKFLQTSAHTLRVLAPLQLTQPSYSVMWSYQGTGHSCEIHSQFSPVPVESMCHLGDYAPNSQGGNSGQIQQLG